MATPYQKRKARVGKYNPKNIMFTDFSEGLYLLDTPRDITEQLGSLALKGGRNVMAEKGALVPQYGYYPLTETNELPVEEKIVAVTKDDKSSSSFFIVTNYGNVYLYTAFQGLKKYKTVLETTNDNILTARTNNNMIMYYNGAGYLFGDYYEEAESVTVDTGCSTRNFGSYAEVDVPVESKQYYWNGKKVNLSSSGVYTVTNMTKGEGKVYKPYNYADIKNLNTSYMRGYISLNRNQQVIDLGEGNTISCVATKHTGTAQQETSKTILEYECYRYEAIAPSLLSIPATGYVYFKPNPTQGTPSRATSSYSKTDNSDNLSSLPSGYTFNINNANGVISIWQSGNAFSGCRLFRDQSGDIYKTVTESKEVEGEDYYTYKVSINLRMADGTTWTYSSADKNAGLYEWEIRNRKDTSTTFSLRLPNTGTNVVNQTYDSNLSLLDSGLATIKGVRVSGSNKDDILNESQEDLVTLVLVPDPDNTEDIATTVDISEKTFLPIDLVYTPEEESQEQKVLIPTLLEVCVNRLCIVNYDGFIYYTGVGVTKASGELKLNESEGAGYFGGFFNDNSKTLALDDYMTGILISKQNGLYYLTIADTFSSQSVSADSQSGINIKKIAEIGQQYPTDHLVVREQVYAYDSNSDSIVLAATTNMFGSVVSGKVLIDAEFLNAQNFGIASSKRCLTFNKDAQVFILYYGDDLKHGIVLNSTGNLFPRELDRPMIIFQGFNQGVIGITKSNVIVQDYHKNTIIPDIVPVADFEAIGLKDSRCICSSIAEVSELNGIEYDFLTTNTLTSFQHIKPYTNFGIDKLEIPPMIYSDALRTYDSYGVLPEEEDIPPIDLAKIKGLNKWADKKSNSTRIYAPMSGRAGINICIQFPANVAFCLAGIRLNDFSQGD